MLAQFYVCVPLWARFVERVAHECYLLISIYQATRSGPNSRRRGQNTAYTIDGRIRVAAYVRVSTDGDEQLGSFESQKNYYEEKIASTPEWQMVGIFADEAITGTKVDKREGFQAMIHKCMNGEIDMCDKGYQG